MATSDLAEAFIAWFDRYGEQSHDPYDFWATSLGRRAKRLYYRRTILESPAALPFVLLDTFIPNSRLLVSLPQRYPIADAHYALGFFAWGEATGDSRAVSRGEHFLGELHRSRSPGFDEFCWGATVRLGVSVGHDPCGDAPDNDCALHLRRI